MKKSTVLVHAGRRPEAWHGAVNPPVYRCSTILAPTGQELKRRDENWYDEFCYGIHGTPTSRSLEEGIAAVEGGLRCVTLESGLAAITATMLSFLKSGDHVLVCANAYGPTRLFCDKTLAAFGIETTYYDPRIGAGIADLIDGRTRLILAESPGSLTFEIQDVPAIAAAAHARGVVLALDNTWGILSFSPFEKGVDISIQAGTKYIAGHSDALLGAVSVVRDDLYARLRQTIALYGFCVGSEEAWLGQRGLRTLALRLERQFSVGREIALWLEQRPEIERVLHPALPSHPDHALWRRDFKGGCGLFSVVLKPEFSAQAADAMVDGYECFGIGYSWGGFESLAVSYGSDLRRPGAPLETKGTLVRYHIGLEDPEDLIADLEKGFDRLRAASGDCSSGVREERRSS